MNSERRYKFSWALLGNIAQGRPNLGFTTRLEVYRLMQCSFRDILERDFGTEKADEIFYEAGKLAGVEFYRNVIGDSLNLEDFFRHVQESLKEMGIGILRVEEADEDAERFVVTIAEDLDCSGLPEIDYEICVYDEGFIAALLESFLGKKFSVNEVDCWCTGDRTCRFVAKVKE
jgi:predicted hydrocarbon binding protein